MSSKANTPKKSSAGSTAVSKSEKKAGKEKSVDNNEGKSKPSKSKTTEKGTPKKQNSKAPSVAESVAESTTESVAEKRRKKSRPSSVPPLAGIKEASVNLDKPSGSQKKIQSKPQPNKPVKPPQKKKKGAITKFLESIGIRHTHVHVTNPFALDAIRALELEQWHLQRLKRRFDQIDIDGSGTIDASEFLVSLKYQMNWNVYIYHIILHYAVLFICHMATLLILLLKKT